MSITTTIDDFSLPEVILRSKFRNQNNYETI